MSSAADEARLQNARDTIDCKYILFGDLVQVTEHGSPAWYVAITSNWLADPRMKLGLGDGLTD
jgi:hypothetical protein